MSSSFANQVLAQVELWQHDNKYPVGVCVLPKKQDEHVARLELKRLIVELTEQTPELAACIHVPKVRINLRGQRWPTGQHRLWRSLGCLLPGGGSLSEVEAVDIRLNLELGPRLPARRADRVRLVQSRPAVIITPDCHGRRRLSAGGRPDHVHAESDALFRCSGRFRDIWLRNDGQSRRPALPAPSPPGQMLTTPFGGVRRDLLWAKTAESTAKLRYVADLPLSVIGDFVTLPKTVIGTHSDALLQDHDSSVADGLAGTPANTAASP